jgi:UDP-glucose-4-epimerase
MKVLITGGAGYIGSHTNLRFHEKGVDTVVLDDLSDGHREAVIAGEFIQGDFGDRLLLDRLMSEHDFDAVIHFAAFASVPDSVKRPERYYRNNITNMQTLLDACVTHKINNFVFSSSASTFGEPIYTPIDEQHPQTPINPYGMTKLIGEKMLADYERAYGLRYCAFRYFCAAGDDASGRIGESHDPETHLIPVMLRALLTGSPFTVFGTEYKTRDGSCVRDFVHVNDLAEAHCLGLEYIMKCGKSDCFNLGSGKGFTVLEMIDALKEVSGSDVPYLIGKKREGDPAVLVATYTKAAATLGWQPKHSDIHIMLGDALEWERHRRY